jgi:hypothetical protein
MARERRTPLNRHTERHSTEVSGSSGSVEVERPLENFFLPVFSDLNLSLKTVLRADRPHRGIRRDGP